ILLVKPCQVARFPIRELETAAFQYPHAPLEPLKQGLALRDGLPSVLCPAARAEVGHAVRADADTWHDRLNDGGHSTNLRSFGRTREQKRSMHTPRYAFGCQALIQILTWKKCHQSDTIYPCHVGTGFLFPPSWVERERNACMPAVLEDISVQVSTNKDADLTVKKAGDLALAKIDLFVNNHTPLPSSVFADFTLATFTGYVQKAVAGFTANETNLDGSVGTTATTVLSCVGPGDATGENVYGYLMRAAAAGDPLIAAVKLSSPVPLNTPADVLNLVPTFRLP